MEPEDSLPHPQAPTTCPYLKADKSSPWLSISLREDFFPSGLPTKIPYAPLLFPYVSHTQPISFFLFDPPE